MKTKKTLTSLLVTLIMSCIAMFSLGMTASANTYAAVKNAAEETGVQYMIDTSGIEGLLKDVQSSLQKIGLVVAGIAVLALAILFITGGSQGLQKGKGMAISILVGVIVLALGVTLVSSIYNAV
jgi:hypothetical protein